MPGPRSLLWYVAVGSAAGGVLRYLVGLALQRAAGTTFPIGTLFINVTGSLLLGFLVRYFAEGTGAGPELRALLTTGLCGGYTTFSTFSVDTVRLVEDGDWGRGTLYVGLSVGLSLAAALAGVGVAREVLALRRGV